MQRFTSVRTVVIVRTIQVRVITAAAKSAKCSFLTIKATRVILVAFIVTIRCSYHHFGILIHAPHTRSDRADKAVKAIAKISIHAPHTRSDAESIDSFIDDIFQSTLLIRGAT